MRREQGQWRVSCYGVGHVRVVSFRVRLRWRGFYRSYSADRLGVIIGQNNAIAGFTGRECSSASFAFDVLKVFVMTRIVPLAFNIQGFSIEELRGILRCEFR
jgi:hypothetical protein